VRRALHEDAIAVLATCSAQAVLLARDKSEALRSRLPSHDALLFRVMQARLSRRPSAVDTPRLPLLPLGLTRARAGDLHEPRTGAADAEA